MLSLLHRTCLVVAVAAVTSGCSVVQRVIKSGDPKTFASASALVQEKKYVEAADELRRLKAEYDFNPRSPNGRSLYGELVEQVACGLGTDPLVEAENAAKSSERRAKAVQLAARLSTNFKALEGLPLDALKVERYSTKTLNERRAKVEERVAELVAGAEKQAALIREDEKAGRVGFALYEWSRFMPATEAQAQERDAKLLELARALFSAAGGTFALDVTRDAAKNLGLAAVDGRRIAQARFDTLSFVAPDKADAAVLVGAKQPQVKRSTGTVTLEWRYPTGQREVVNPDYTRLEEKIAYADKQAAYYRGKYERINCGRGGSLRGRTKAPNGDCAKADYGSWQKYARDGESARKSLSRTRPRKMETVYATYPYAAREDVVTVEQPVLATITYRGGRKERVTQVATLTMRAYTHPGHAPVKLKARAEKLAPDDVVLGLFQPKVAEQVVEAVKAAQAGLLAGQKAALSADGGGAAASAEVELRARAQQLFRKSLPMNIIEAAAKERLGEPLLQESPPIGKVFNRGVDSLTWERLVAFAEAEASEQHTASAYVTWMLAPAYDDATRALKDQKLAEVTARLARERVLAWTIDAPGPAAEVGARLGSLLAPLPGYPRATGTPRLSLTIFAPAPKPVRESAEVKLEHEYVVSEETVENPAFVEHEALRAEYEASHNALGLTMLRTGTPPPETIVQKNMEQVSYAARREAANMEAEVSVKATWDGRELAFTVPVNHTVEAFTHPGRTDVKLEARAQKLGTDGELVAAWQAAAAQAVFDALLARMHPVDGVSAGAKLDATLLDAIRRKPGPDSIDQACSQLIQETLGVSPFGVLHGVNVP